MSTDLFIAGFPVPRDGFDFAAARQAAHALTDDELRAINDEHWLELDDVRSLREALLSAISTVENGVMGSSRDVGNYYFGVDSEVHLLLTGGWSSGDSPTDEFDDFELIATVEPVHRALLRATGAQ